MPHPHYNVFEEHLDLLKKYAALQRECLALYAELERHGIQVLPFDQDAFQDNGKEKEVDYVLQ